MIHTAEQRDIDSIVTMLMAFHEEGGFSEFGPFDTDGVREMLSAWVQCKEVVVLVAKGDKGEHLGACAAVMYPLWYSKAVIAAGDLFWWVKPSSRGSGVGAALLKGLEDELSSLGCVRLLMGVSDELSAAAGAGLVRAGFSKFRDVFTKEL